MVTTEGRDYMVVMFQPDTAISRKDIAINAQRIKKIKHNCCNAAQQNVLLELSR